jgi:hypothetical protein
MNTKRNFVVEFRLDAAEVEQFSVTIKDASDITDAIYKAQDVARGVMNLSPYDDSPRVKSVTERAW